MKKIILHLILTSTLLFSFTACQKDSEKTPLPESQAPTQTEESSQAAEEETEPVNLAKEDQNEFYRVVFDSFSEDLEVYNLEIFGDVPMEE